MANTIISPKILSPVMLWENFDAAQPLKESVIGEEVYDDIVYRETYFSGRETNDGRVRIFGVYAKSKSTGKKSNKGAILILPDFSDTVNYDVINLYVKQGYAVLMVDYRGKFGETENYTKYPESVSYANYENCKDAIDEVTVSAWETCWYEWAAVAKYAVSFLKSLPEIERVGVLGIKNGANIGWILCGTDARVDCFVPLFGAGWRGYKGVFKNGSEEIRADDSHLRFLAGIDAHAYAQYVKCPVFYMGASNSPDFDFDRTVDTMMRISDGVIRYTNYAPYYRDVLNKNCKRNVDLFFAKYLLDFKLLFPEEPVLSCMVDENVLSCDVELDFSDLKKPKTVTVYVAEGGVNPANRDWQPAVMLKGLREDKKSFTYKISGNCEFVTLYAVVEYRSGVTVSSNSVCKKVSLNSPFPQKLLYSAKDRYPSFSTYDLASKSIGGLFFENDDGITVVPGANGIMGISSPYGSIVSYKMNNQNVALNSNSIVLADVYAEDYTSLKVTLMVEASPLETVDYSCVLDLKGGNIWQNVSIKAVDFKNAMCLSVKDYSKVVAIRFETENKCVYNNVLII